MERKGIKLLEELLQTEKNYIEQLSEIIKYLDYTEKSKMPENLVTYNFISYSNVFHRCAKILKSNLLPHAINDSKLHIHRPFLFAY